MRKLERSRVNWAGHVKKMEGERLTKRLEGRRSEMGGLHEERFGRSEKGD